MKLRAEYWAALQTLLPLILVGIATLGHGRDDEIVFEY
jgi:hypothetical protein